MDEIPAAHIPALTAWLMDAVGESAVAKGLAIDGEGLDSLLSGAALPDEDGMRALLRMAETAEAAGLGTRPEMPCVPIQGPPAAMESAGPEQAPPALREAADIRPEPQPPRPVPASRGEAPPIPGEIRLWCLDSLNWAARLHRVSRYAPAIHRWERGALQIELGKVLLELVEDHHVAVSALGLAWYDDDPEREAKRLKERLRRARRQMPGWMERARLWFEGKWPVEVESTVARGERAIRFYELVTREKIY